MTETTGSRASASAAGRRAPEKPRSQPLSAAELAEATLRLSQQVGIDGVTMKLLGEELGVSTMAAYRHVATRQELLELAAETVINRVVASDPHEGPWDDRMRAILFALREELRPYPWVVQLLASRGVLPERDWRSGAMFPLLLEIGFKEATAMKLLGFINAFIVGSLVDVKADWGGRRPRRRPRPSHPTITPETDARWVFGVEMLVTVIRARLEADGARRHR